jgi:thioredoxin-related protein
MLKKNFVLLALTRGKDFIPQEFAVQRVPKHFFLTKNGEIISSFLGYWNPEDFASFVQDAKEKNK